MERLIVGIDGSYEADRALHWAVAEAQIRKASVELIHAFVLHPYTPMFGDTDRDLAEARLTEAVDRNRALLDRVKWSSTTVDATGAAAAALVDAAKDADLVVVGARGAGGFQKLSLGSTGYRTAAHAPAPVAVIPGERTDRDGRRSLVVGVDETPPSARALQWALDEAAMRATAVTVAHSYLLPVDMAPTTSFDPRPFEESHERAHREAVALVERMVADAAVPEAVEVDQVARAGTPAGVLLDLTDDHMLVVGTRGRGSFSRAVFGSVSQQVLHHATAPVVVVP